MLQIKKKKRKEILSNLKIVAALSRLGNVRSVGGRFFLAVVRAADGDVSFSSAALCRATGEGSSTARDEEPKWLLLLPVDAFFKFLQGQRTKTCF